MQTEGAAPLIRPHCGKVRGKCGASSAQEKTPDLQNSLHRAAPSVEQKCAPLRLGFSESPPSGFAAIKTNTSPIEAKEPKLWPFEEGRSISSLAVHWGQGKHGPDQSPKRLILLSPSGDFNGQWECPNFTRFFSLLKMRADLHTCWWTWDLGANTANFRKRSPFYGRKISEFTTHNRNFFLTDPELKGR